MSRRVSPRPRTPALGRVSRGGRCSGPPALPSLWLGALWRLEALFGGLGKKRSNSTDDPTADLLRAANRPVLDDPPVRPHNAVLRAAVALGGRRLVSRM